VKIWHQIQIIKKSELIAKIPSVRARIIESGIPDREIDIYIEMTDFNKYSFIVELE